MFLFKAGWFLGEPALNFPGSTGFIFNQLPTRLLEEQSGRPYCHLSPAGGSVSFLGFGGREDYKWNLKRSRTSIYIYNYNSGITYIYIVISWYYKTGTVLVHMINMIRPCGICLGWFPQLSPESRFWRKPATKLRLLSVATAATAATSIWQGPLRLEASK